MKNKDLLAYGAALGAAFFWSFSFVWFKIAYFAYNPITVVITGLFLAQAKRRRKVQNAIEIHRK